MKITSESLNDTLKIGRHIAKSAQKGDIICLFGGLGAGKTVLTKGIAQGLGIDKSVVISPTFVLLRQYNNAKLSLYHFDLYRLENFKAIQDLGYDEYFYGDGLSVVEWADRLGPLAPGEFLKIEISIVSATKRLFNFSSTGSHYKELLGRIHEHIRH